MLGFNLNLTAGIENEESKCTIKKTRIPGDPLDIFTNIYQISEINSKMAPYCVRTG